MNQEQLIHQWNLKPDSRLLRLYSRSWDEATTDNLTFCRLFWGTLFFPVGLVLTAIVRWGRRNFPPGTYEERIARQRREREARSAKRDKKELAHSDFLTSIQALADRVAAFFQRHPWIGKWSKGAGVTLVVVLGLGLALGVLGLISYGISTWTLASFLYTLMVIGIAIGIAVVTFTSAYLISETPVGPWLYEHPLTKIGHFFRAIGHFLYAGYFVTKSRTCPRVIVSE